MCVVCMQDAQAQAQQQRTSPTETATQPGIDMTQSQMLPPHPPNPTYSQNNGRSMAPPVSNNIMPLQQRMPANNSLLGIVTILAILECPKSYYINNLIIIIYIYIYISIQ